MWTQCQDLGAAVGHGELGRSQKKEDGPRSHLGMMLEAPSGKQTLDKGPIWQKAMGYNFRAYTYGLGAVALFYSLL